MTHFLGVLESLVRDVSILGRSIGVTRGKMIESILGPDGNGAPADNLSELAYFREVLGEQWRNLLVYRWRSPGDIWTALKSVDRMRARFVPLPILGDRPGSIRQHSRKRFAGEAWFFINGVATDKEVLRLNGQRLSQLFMRPIELIHNPTDGVVVDLLECITGRTFDFASETADYALERVDAALSNPEKTRVILMGHSQGGIIVSNVVAGLIQRFAGDARRLRKLEVYTFASASDDMPVDPLLDRPRRHVPFIEHFANMGDLVALLGVLEKRLPINGKVYLLDKPGHLLNAHYLAEFNDTPRYAWPDSKGTRHRDARLYGYLNGGTPASLPVRSRATRSSRPRKPTAVSRRVVAQRSPGRSATAVSEASGAEHQVKAG